MQEPQEQLDFAELHRQRVEGQTTHRERLERKAEKRHEWAESRARKADAAHARVHAIADGIPFGQPILVGHHSERRARKDQARMEQGMRAAVDNSQMADEHESTAEGLESQLAGAIYSDDVDAVERLEEKIRELENQRGRIKAYNASCRAGRRDPQILDKRQLAELESVARAAPYQIGDKGQAPAYWAQNIGGNITRNRKRLEQLKRAAVVVAEGGRGRGRPMVSRFASSCAECGATIDRGAEIVYYKLTREAVHAACDAR